MTWWEILLVVAVGFVIFKFLVKPIFKLVGFALLALAVWWLYNNF